MKIYQLSQDMMDDRYDTIIISEDANKIIEEILKDDFDVPLRFLLLTIWENGSVIDNVESTKILKKIENEIIDSTEE